MIKLFLVPALVVASASAQAATLDFEDKNAGDIITAFDIDGITGTVVTIGGSNQAMVFDSDVPTGGDGDLQAPFYEELTGATPPAGTPVTGTNQLNPGKILIISEDGDSKNPDDNATGGSITFNFDSAVTFIGFDVFDDVSNFAVTANTGDNVGFSLGYDNQFRSISGLNWTGVTSVVFDFQRSSGAIDNISFVAPVPVPASLPLMLAGLAGLGYWRKRKSKH